MTQFTATAVSSPLWFVALNYVSRALMVVSINNNTIKLHYTILLTAS